MADPFNLRPIMCQYRIAVGIKSIAIKLAFYNIRYKKSDLITTNNLDFMFINVFMWLSGRTLCQQRKGLWDKFPGNTHTDKKHA